MWTLHYHAVANTSIIFTIILKILFVDVFNVNFNYGMVMIPQKKNNVKIKITLFSSLYWCTTIKEKFCWRHTVL